mmetsp:Transcript_22242/g.30990  ORF Transcript_22242/g.30990 Transcript_22242/m.30990 type:complete len:218 (-) Transcript_22242:131-784(-)
MNRHYDSVVNFIPHSNDVLLGAGAMRNNFPGNQQFRNLVKARKELYVVSHCNHIKKTIAKSIIHQVKSMNPPGRFLKQDRMYGLWQEVPDGVANEKVCRALRERTSSVRGSAISDRRICRALTSLSKDDPLLCMEIRLFRTIRTLSSFRDEEFVDFTMSTVRCAVEKEQQQQERLKEEYKQEEQPRHHHHKLSVPPILATPTPSSNFLSLASTAVAS